jgi:hypothetical protein
MVFDRFRLERNRLSDKIVNVKTISKREMTRKPSQLTAIQPGESMRVEDREGELIVTRPKRHRMTLAEIEAEIDRLGQGVPKIDTLSFLQEGES